jgi:hypothetical protein
MACNCSLTNRITCFAGSSHFTRIARLEFTERRDWVVGFEEVVVLVVVVEVEVIL